METTKKQILFLSLTCLFYLIKGAHGEVMSKKARESFNSYVSQQVAGISDAALLEHPRLSNYEHRLASPTLLILNFANKYAKRYCSNKPEYKALAQDTYQKYIKYSFLKAVSAKRNEATGEGGDSASEFLTTDAALLNKYEEDFSAAQQKQEAVEGCIKKTKKKKVTKKLQREENK